MINPHVIQHYELSRHLLEQVVEVEQKCAGVDALQFIASMPSFTDFFHLCRE
jgi:hypothetical protein